MRMCAECGKGRWQGKKLDGKFVCVECLGAKEGPKEKTDGAKKEEEGEE